MRELGASEWFDGEPRLYFATGEEAKKAIELLSDQLPTSKEVWVIVEESVMVQDANWVR